SEGEERVARAAAGMDSTDGGANAGAFFDQLDTAVEIVAAEKDVIEHGGHVVVRVFGVRGPGDGRRYNRASGQSKKASAGNHPLTPRYFRCEIVARRGASRACPEFKTPIQLVARESTSRRRASTSSARGFGPRSPLLRWRTATVPASASLGPTTSM